jgi:hypothetical protein
MAGPDAGEAYNTLTFPFQFEFPDHLRRWVAPSDLPADIADGSRKGPSLDGGEEVWVSDCGSSHLPDRQVGFLSSTRPVGSKFDQAGRIRCCGGPYEPNSESEPQDIHGGVHTFYNDSSRSQPHTSAFLNS